MLQIWKRAECVWRVVGSTGVVIIFPRSSSLYPLPYINLAFLRSISFTSLMERWRPCIPSGRKSVGAATYHDESGDLAAIQDIQDASRCYISTGPKTFPKHTINCRSFIPHQKNVKQRNSPYNQPPQPGRFETCSSQGPLGSETRGDFDQSLKHVLLPRGRLVQ